MPRPLLAVLFSCALSGVAFSAATPTTPVPVTPDAITWSNTVATATEALLAAQSDVAIRQSVYHRDAVRYSQDVYLRQHSAIAEEDFRTSQWTATESRYELEIAKAKVEVAQAALEMAKIQLAFETGKAPGIDHLASANVHFWEKRAEVARQTVIARNTDRDFRQYKYDIIRRLAANSFDSQSHLLLAKSTLEVAEEAANLALDQQKVIEDALQQSKATLEKTTHTGG